MNEQILYTFILIVLILFISCVLFCCRESEKSLDRRQLRGSLDG